MDGKCRLWISYSNQQRANSFSPGWTDGWIDGWMGGLMGVKAA